MNSSIIPETIWVHNLSRLDELPKSTKEFTLQHYVKRSRDDIEYIRKDLHEGIVSTAALTAYSNAKEELGIILEPILDIAKKLHCFDFRHGGGFELSEAIRETIRRSEK